MEHSIRVKEDVFQELLLLQRPRETYNEIIMRLLLMYKLLKKLEPFISWQTAQLERRVTESEAEKIAMR